MGEGETTKDTLHQGLGVSPGIAEGEVVVHWQDEEEIPLRAITAEEIPGEIARFEAALIATRQELLEIQQRIAGAIGADDASIFDAHLLVVEDRTLIEEALRGLERDRQNIEFVFHQVAEKYCRTLAAIDDPYLQERSVDVEDVTHRIVRHLLGKSRQDLHRLDRPHIIVAAKLTPSDTALINRDLVRGFVTEQGSRTSHSAIMARSLGIPAIVALPEICSKLTTGNYVILDGYSGKLIADPSEKTRAAYGKIEQHKVEVEHRLEAIRETKSCTLDGRHIILSANIELASEIDGVISSGAEGVGLFRTEFLFLNRKSLPSEDEQYEAYKLVAEKCSPHGVIIRTLDIGGDKLMNLPGAVEEPNPFLGRRAIRLCLDEPAMFKNQLRAILRAAVHGHVRVMYPMVTQLEEVRWANALLDECKGELAAEGKAHRSDIEIGTMIEVPSAALIADQLAREVKFFSIGTNDLVQYTMAIDRGNDRIAHLYQPAHPSVLRLLAMTAEAAHRNGIWVGVCGEMASEIHLIPLLLGLGMDELSVVTTAVPRVKKAVQSLDTNECRELARRTAEMSDPQEIENLCRQHAKERYAELFDC
ncbi:MAG: phosphoenolpyruvate--protein phosphotransferase [Chthoniobacterales bacterium]|nr:phosphoenolpyruvate--protein phosphotransferase [Chthoniobacterales bacterium]